MTRLHGPAIRGGLRSRESRRGLLQLGDSLIMYKGSRRRLSIARGDMRFGLRFGPHCVCCAVRWANRVRNAVVEISQNGVYFRRVAPLAQRLEQRPFKSWVVGSNPTGGTAKPLETLASKGFQFPRFLAPDAISRTHRSTTRIPQLADQTTRTIQDAQAILIAHNCTHGSKPEIQSTYVHSAERLTRGNHLFHNRIAPI